MMSNSTTVSLPTWNNCQWCGYIHVGICSRIRCIEYYNDGSVKRVEFFDKFPQNNPLFSDVAEFPAR